MEDLDKILKKVTILENADIIQNQYYLSPDNVDWSLIYKNCIYVDFITRCQDIFKYDIEENFYSYKRFYIRNLSISSIHLPVIEYGPLRLYIETGDIFIPIFLDRTYNKSILKSFGLSEDSIDNILFYISENKDSIKKQIKQKTIWEDWIPTFHGQFNIADIASNNIIVEKKFELKTPGFSRILWLQENQNVSHGPRIKVQDKKNKTKSSQFGYIEAHGDFKECYCDDNDLTKQEKLIIKSFVKENQELIKKTFYPKYKNYTFDVFYENCIHVDLSGRPIKSDSEQASRPDFLLSTGQITLDDVIFVDLKETGKNEFCVIKYNDTHYNVYHPEYGICFNRWFKMILPFDRDDIGLYKFTVIDHDNKTIEVDINGNFVKNH